jgi:hypothetical protein
MNTFTNFCSSGSHGGSAARTESASRPKTAAAAS